MNQYKPSQTLLSQFDQLFNLSTQAMQHPLYKPSQSHPSHPVSNPHPSLLNRPINLGNYQSFDSLADPTKRIRHSQQSFTKASPNTPKISYPVQSTEQPKLPIDMADLTMKDNLSMLSSDKLRSPSSPFGEDLVIPDTCKPSQDAYQKLAVHMYQRMLQQQQMQQRKAQMFMQQQFMMHLAKQQMQNQFKVDPKVAQLYQNLASANEAKKVKSENSSDSQERATCAETSDEENTFQYIKVENPNILDVNTLEETNSAKSTEKPLIKNKPNPKRKTQESKRINNDQYWSEYSKILGNTIHRKTTEEPRHKNKWQCQKGEEASPQENQAIEKSPEAAQEQKQSKPKPVDIPQHMQDDSMIDYENLISMTITNDPAYTGTEDSKTTFVMINKDTNSSCVQARDTRVGDRYQVSVPEIKGKVAGKRRSPKAIWKPEVVKASELKAYFDELCQIFSCEKINQEQALRLLKSKKYRKERVCVNIGKSRKYYAKVLMAPGQNDENL